MHALDVFWCGFQPNEDYGLAQLAASGGVFSGERDLAASCPWGGWQPFADYGGGFQPSHIELWVQKRVDLLGVDHRHCLSGSDLALIDQVAGDLEGSGCGALAITGLQHEELAILDGELHVLHVVVVVFQPVDDLDELVVDAWVFVLQLIDGLRCPDASHNILTLSVHQELAIQTFVASGRVPGERDSGTGGVAGIAEHHGLHIHRGTPGGRDVIHPAVIDRPWVVPGAEDRLDRAEELLDRIGREITTDFGLVLSLELLSQLLQIGSSQLGVLGNSASNLHLIDEFLEVGLADLHHHIGVHLNESAVRVVGETRIIGLFGESLRHLVVHPQVKNGVHHSGHGGPRTGAHRDQQRVV